MVKHPTLLALCGAIAGLILASCFNPLDTPEKVHLKGSPEFALPIGDKNTEMSEYFSHEKLVDQMASGSELMVYSYPHNPNNALTLLLYYPVKPQKISFSADEFDFKIPPNSTKFDITIPAIAANGSLSFTYAPLASISGSYPVPIATLIPQEANRTITLTFPQTAGDTTFKKAQVKTGSLSFSGTHNFSQVKLVLKSASGTPSSQEVSFSGSSFPLDGKWIFSDTKIVLEGTLGVSASHSSAVTINYNLNVTEVSQIVVNTKSAYIKEEIPFKFDDIANWATEVQFDRLKFSIQAQPRIEGIEVKISETNSLFWRNPQPVAIQTLVRDGLSIDGDPSPSNPGKLKFQKNFSKVTYEILGLSPDITTFDNKIVITVNAPNTPKDVTLYDVEPGKIKTFTITPSMDFHWTEATITPASNEKFIPPAPQIFPEFTGGSSGGGFNIKEMLNGSEGAIDLDNIEFQQANMYLYLNLVGLSPGDNLFQQTDITLTYKTENDVLWESLTEQSTPVGSGSFDPAKFKDKTTYEPDHLPVPFRWYKIQDIFNDRPADLHLSYKVQFSGQSSLNISNTAGTTDVAIEPYVIIELPFKFAIDGTAGLTLDFGSNSNRDDILGRTSATPDDDPLDYLSTILLDLDYDNQLGLNGAQAVLNLQGGRTIDLMPLQAGKHTTSITVDKADLGWPVIPESVTLKPSPTTTLINGQWPVDIKEGGSIKLNIKARVKANFDKDFDFPSTSSSSNN